MRVRIVSFLFVILLAVQAVVGAAPLAPEISAEAGYLMVVDSANPMLFGKNQDKIMYPASTTKIMTLLLALEKGDLNSVVTVSPKAASCADDESRLGLEAGNQLMLRELLKGMMAVSGNDAAKAVAEHIGGSIDDFVDMMNVKANKLGAVHTHFSNPHGLTDNNHFTTARDLAIITSYAIKQKGFIDFVAKQEQTVTFIQPSMSITVHNTNKLLKTYWGANGVKTGTTEAAGNCLVASAKRGNIQLIAVVLNADDTEKDCRWQDASDLLDYGFAKLIEKK
ncbi:MAG: D-alanyl-D-alanine carboxypeptidase [Pelosinus sp.]|nr:D-alanyl-D-alanine carboxypeptidase [Pelosinus sp.]